MPPLPYYYGFRSYQEFEAFDTALAQQLAAGHLAATTPPRGTDTSFPYQPEAWYWYAGSLEMWVLSTPDNAWRGYFLPLTEAVIYQQKLRRRDQRGKLGCLLLVLLAGALLSWQSIRLFLDGLLTSSP